MSKPKSMTAAEYSAHLKAQREARKSTGLCPSCGKPVEGRIYCLECAARTTTCGVRRKQIARNNGFCWKCEKNPVVQGRSMCFGCLEGNNRRSEDRRDSYAREKVCARCGKQRAPGKSKCADCLERDQRAYRERRTAGICWGCNSMGENGQTYCAACKKLQAERAWLRHRKLRLEVFTAYGGPRCACCGEEEPEFLQIDHIDGGGAKHRKEVKSSNQLYAWLKRNSFPPGFQVLCANCNHGKAKLGYCPHRPPQDLVPRIGP